MSKTITDAFRTAWVNKGSKFAVYKINYKRRYWDGAAVVDESSWQTLTMPGAQFKSIGSMTYNLSSVFNTEFTTSNATVSLLNSDYRWTPENTAGIFGIDSTATSGYLPRGTKMQVYAGYELADGTFELVSMFSGVLVDYCSKPAEGIFEAYISGYEEYAKNGDAENVSDAFTLEDCIPATGDGTTTDFRTTSIGVGYLTVLQQNAVTKAEGVDYTVSDLDSVFGALISMKVAPTAGHTMKSSGKKWKAAQALDTLAGLLCDEAGITAGMRDISPVIISGGASGSKTIDTQAEWEAGTSITGIDTTSSPGSIKLSGATDYAYTGATDSYVVPVGVTQIYVSLVGPGGGGGGGGALASSGGGGGGGSGGHIGSGGAASGGAAGSSTYIKRGGTTLAQAAIGAGGDGGPASPGVGGAAGSSVSSGLTLVAGGGAAGGAGGSGGVGFPGVRGSAGAAVYGLITVTPGETLTVFAGHYGGPGLPGDIGGAGSHGSNGSLSITVAAGVYESEVFDILSTPSAWGLLTKVETLYGGTTAYYTAASADGISFDAYTAITGGGFIDSTLRQYFKVKVVITATSLGVSPVIDSIVSSFSTSTVNLSIANFKGMMCDEALQKLAFACNYEIGFDSDGVFFFRPRNNTSPAFITFNQTDILAKLNWIKPGWNEVLNYAQIGYGSSYTTYSSASLPETGPTSQDKYFKRKTSATIDFILANDVNLAGGLAQSIHDEWYRARRQVSFDCRLIPQAEIGDVMTISFYDDPLLENNFWGDPLISWAPVFGVPMNVGLRSFTCRIIELTHDFDAGLSRVLGLEVLS